MAYEQTVAVVDYYQELNLDKDDATPDIQVQLNKIRMQWRQRASLNGNRGEEARAKLKMIENASNVFSNEDSRDAYDRSLRALPEVAEQDIDWIGRAWTYYFADDPGAASVAARKARSEHGDDPNAHVISAWIELAEENWREAKGYADEAYVLDELGEDTVDVYRVRGVTFYFTKKYGKGIECFQRALTKAPREMVPDIAFRMAACYIRMEQYTRAIDICVEGLKADAEMGPDTCDAVTHYCCVRNTASTRMSSRSRRTGSVTCETSSPDLTCHSISRQPSSRSSISTSSASSYCRFHQQIQTGSLISRSKRSGSPFSVSSHSSHTPIS